MPAKIQIKDASKNPSFLVKSALILSSSYEICLIVNPIIKVSIDDITKGIDFRIIALDEKSSLFGITKKYDVIGSNRNIP